MKSGIIFCYLLFLPFCQFGQTDSTLAYQKGEEALKLMETNQLDEALVLLSQARKLDKKNIIYPYEMAYAYYLKKSYKSAIKTLKKIKKHEDVNELVYQLIGNCYYLLNDTGRSIKAYEDGLSKFPQSGALYLELGNLELLREAYNPALKYYKKGIEVDPNFSSNYYWVSKVYALTTEEVWSLIYGEIFMNLERNSERTIEISNLLYQVYKNELRIESDSVISVSFSQTEYVKTDSDAANQLIPFGVGIFEPLLIRASLGEISVNMESLSRIRSRFTTLYFTEKYNETHPNILFEYQQEIANQGLSDAYHHWVLMQGDIDAFESWYENHKTEWQAFANWFASNLLKIE
jgi:tetratricopeptide (TPR) repeat protein